MREIYFRHLGVAERGGLLLSRSLLLHVFTCIGRSCVISSRETFRAIDDGVYVAVKSRQHLFASCAHRNPQWQAALIDDVHRGRRLRPAHLLISGQEAAPTRYTRERGARA